MAGLLNGAAGGQGPLPWACPSFTLHLTLPTCPTPLGGVAITLLQLIQIIEGYPGEASVEEWIQKEGEQTWLLLCPLLLKLPKS